MLAFNKFSLKLSDVSTCFGKKLIILQIIRTFTKIRELLATNEALQRKMIEMEKKYDGKIKDIFDTLGFLLEDKIKPKKQIGFK